MHKHSSLLVHGPVIIYDEVMTSKDEILQGIKTGLPLAFGAEYLDAAEFRDKFNAWVQVVTERSNPYLSAETVRYQSMLLYLTLLFVAAKIFKVHQFKIGEAPIAVDKVVFGLFELLLGALAAVFVLKAYVDSQRSRLAQSRDLHPNIDVAGLIERGNLSRLIDLSYWNEVFDSIGAVYKSYDDALYSAMGKEPNFKHIAVQAIRLDRDALSSDTYLKARLDKCDLFLGSLGADLNRDHQEFQREVQLVLSSGSRHEDDLADFSWYDNHSKIESLFKQHLSKWFDARNELSSVALDSAILSDGGPDSARIKAAVAVASRLRRIRRIYAVLEVITPLLFFLAAVLIAAFR